ncbi:MAG: NAD+ synthase [Hyphomicrobiales bacterium]|nr:NAD+ synthase [Hyphomicrobiales bacterium]MCP5373428.1 NAD+ synthase [Hyphomicrobiales bacterium]
MTDTLTIALAQMNPTVGALDANLDLLRRARAEGAAAGADVVVTTELAVAGYPPEDLVLKGAFQDGVEAAVRALATETGDGGPALVIGAPWRVDGRLYNAALVLDGGAIAATVLKHHLPNYGVFDEIRVFSAGPLPEPVMVRGVAMGLMVCEDMWFPDVAAGLAEGGAEMLVVPNGSPYEADKLDERLTHARARVAETGLPLVYVNQVGGQDELVFDGGSFVVAADGAVRARMADWESGLTATRWTRAGAGWTCAEGPLAPVAEPLESIYRALVTGIRDYVGKNRFPGVLIGMSGGIDSALSAAVAVDALGPDRVHCVMMPSPYTSQASLDDAADAAGLLGVRLDSIGIEPAMRAFDAMLRDQFTGRNADTTEENVQARSRGITLMALSNKFGYMVLSTGNKSEMSVGYATLYGDMCGGYNVLKDVYKTTVFALARWRNGHRPAGALGPAGPVVPEAIITKPPTAELKPNQTDQDTLPPYDVLDDILHGLIEDEMSRTEIAARGHDPETVQRVWRLLDLAEYKRRQAPPGVKITRRAFGRDRRYPITNAFKG